MSNVLLDACKECLADRGRTDDKLAQEVHDFIHENFEEKGKSWNYLLIDSVIDAFDKIEEKKQNQPEFRELDGVYFRVERNNKWQNICFSDLTEEEMTKVLENKDLQWVKNLCRILGKRIREIGDSLGLSCVSEEDE